MGPRVGVVGSRWGFTWRAGVAGCGPALTVFRASIQNGEPPLVPVRPAVVVPWSASWRRRWRMAHAGAGAGAGRLQGSLGGERNHAAHGAIVRIRTSAETVFDVSGGDNRSPRVSVAGSRRSPVRSRPD